MQNETTIRLQSPADTHEALRAFLKPIETAFTDEFSEPEFEFSREGWEVDRLIGALDGETPVGTAGAITYRLTVPGGSHIGAAGITMVGVAPSHRRRGILRQMMRWLLDQARERGEPIAILWASEGAIYQRFGYGLATIQGQFDIEPTYVKFLRPAEPLGQVRMLERDEAVALFPVVYDQVRSRTPGTIVRGEVDWRHMLHDAEWMRNGNGPKYRAILEVDREPRAFTTYRAKGEWNDRGPNTTLLVFEVIGVDPAAERAMWEWIIGIDLVGHVKAMRTPVPHPLFLQLTDPRRLGMTIGDGLWIRLIDMQAALEARGYGGAGTMTFELSDAFCPWNAGRWRLNVSDDGPRVTGERGEPGLLLDTADLAAAYLGTFTFAQLARAGRVKECHEGAVATADAMFATATPPWCSTMF
jgi:predicted acetyltransferase